MKIDHAINIDDIRKLAQRTLPRFAFDFIEGGAEDELGLERNRAAFDRHALLPRYLIDVETIDQSVELFGRTYASPFGIAPTGIAGLFRPGADIMLAEAARAANIPFVLSGSGTASIEAAAKAAPEHTWFQLYGSKAWTYSEDMIRRAEGAGISTLVLTVDVPVSSLRERNFRNGFKRPLRLSPRMVFDALTHPGWTTRYLLSGGLPKMDVWTKYARDGASADEVADVMATQTPASGQTWETFARIRAMWPRTLLVKGILHPDDALRAIVSNHGARQLDRAPAPLEVLPAIRRMTSDRLPLIFDSGIRRGSDILIALCLGAKAVMFGRPTLYGAAAAGRPGIDKAIHIMRQEVTVNMKQLGCPRLADLGPDFLWPRPGNGA